MPKFSITFATDIRAYCDAEIEAATQEEATEKALRMAKDWPGGESTDDMVFNPAYDSIGDIEVIDVNDMDRTAIELQAVND